MEDYERSASAKNYSVRTDIHKLPTDIHIYPGEDILQPINYLSSRGMGEFRDVKLYLAVALANRRRGRRNRPTRNS